MPRLIQVIESEVSRGAGTELDRCRTVRQYHTPDGELLAEHDPCAPERDYIIPGDVFARHGKFLYRGADGPTLLWDGEKLSVLQTP